jgi:hypothetical protein
LTIKSTSHTLNATFSIALQPEVLCYLQITLPTFANKTCVLYARQYSIVKDRKSF